MNMNFKCRKIAWENIISFKSEKQIVNDDPKYLPENIRQEIFIVMPAYNEVTTVGSVVYNLSELYQHVFIVDDGSSDNTSSGALSSGATALHPTVSLGQSAALHFVYSIAEGPSQSYNNLHSDVTYFKRY